MKHWAHRGGQDLAERHEQERDAPVVARAKPLPRKLPLASEAPELVPARMINEALYCERLMYLEWAQGEFADNAFTVDGRAVHARADTAGGELPPPAFAPTASGGETGSKVSRAKVRTSADDDDDDEGASDPGPAPYQARSIWLSSEALGMTAKIDVVEGDSAGLVVPIEYKREIGARAALRAGAPPARARLPVRSRRDLLRANTTARADRDR